MDSVCRAGLKDALHIRTAWLREFRGSGRKETFEAAGRGQHVMACRRSAGVAEGVLPSPRGKHHAAGPEFCPVVIHEVVDAAFPDDEEFVLVVMTMQRRAAPRRNCVNDDAEGSLRLMRPELHRKPIAERVQHCSAVFRYNYWLNRYFIGRFHIFQVTHASIRLCSR